MAKILHFPKTDSQTPADFIKESIGILEENKPKNVLIAYKLEDGTVMTGYFNCDFGDRQEMLGHIQCDIIDQMILANLGDRY